MLSAWFRREHPHKKRMICLARALHVEDIWIKMNAIVRSGKNYLALVKGCFYARLPSVKRQRTVLDRQNTRSKLFRGLGRLWLGCRIKNNLGAGEEERKQIIIWRERWMKSFPNEFGASREAARKKANTSGGSRGRRRTHLGAVEEEGERKGEKRHWRRSTIIIKNNTIT